MLPRSIVVFELKNVCMLICCSSSIALKPFCEPAYTSTAAPNAKNITAATAIIFKLFLIRSTLYQTACYPAPIKREYDSSIPRAECRSNSD
jgi:hypothetical protein